MINNCVLKCLSRSMLSHVVSHDNEFVTNVVYADGYGRCWKISKIYIKKTLTWRKKYYYRRWNDNENFFFSSSLDYTITWVRNVCLCALLMLFSAFARIFHFFARKHILHVKVQPTCFSLEPILQLTSQRNAAQHEWKWIDDAGQL